MTITLLDYQDIHHDDCKCGAGRGGLLESRLSEIMSRHTAAVRMNLYRISAGFLGWCWVSAEYISLKPAPALEVSEVLHFSLTLFCGKNINIQIEMIQAWLHKIGEPVNDPDNVILTNKEVIKHNTSHAIYAIIII